MAATILLGCACVRAGAQDQQEIEIRGTVHSEPDVLLHGYVVEITQLAGLHESRRTDVNSDGTFTMRNVPAGDYTLSVMTYQGGVLKQEFVTVRDRPTVLDVTLPHDDHARPGGPVSVRELQHPPARKAVEAAAAAQKFARAGNQAKAVEQLQKALRISPDFAVAHSNLAVQYIRMREYERARREIQEALVIAGPNAVDLCNLAFADAVEQRLPEAFEAVRAALRADPGYANAHYVLGSLLILDRQTAPEGIRHLEQAAPTIPGAREMLRHVRTTQ